MNARRDFRCPQCDNVSEQWGSDLHPPCPVCSTPTNVTFTPGETPAIVEHSIYGTYFRPKYNEGLGKWVKSERHRLQLAEKLGAVPKR